MALKRLQGLSEKKRKAIFWIVIVIAGIILLVFFIKNTGEKLSKLQNGFFSSQMNISGLKENLNQVPSKDIGDTIKAIQETLNQNKNETERETESK